MKSDSFGGAVAHASAAISRSGNGLLRAAVDAAACDEGLLRHGEANGGGGAGVPCDVQHGAVAVHAAGRVC